MDIFIICILLAIGLVLIAKGGDFFVDGASWLAEVSGIPKFIIGATIVSVATTLPEIVVSLISAKSQPDMAIGNAVGSVVFNTGIIMSIALIAQPFVIKRREYAFKGILLAVVMLALSIFSFKGVDISNITSETKGLFGYIGSFVLLAFFVAFIIENIISTKKHAQEEIEDSEKPAVSKTNVTVNVLKLIFGAIAIAGGAILLKNNAVALATKLGMSQSVIGVTILAIGTSLPELVTMIIAVKKGSASLSIGNIIGANVIDLTIILPISAFIASGAGLVVSNDHLLITMPVTLLIISLGIIPTLIFKKFSRWQGVMMLVIYLAYFTHNIISVI